MESLKGQFLVAMPTMGDERFHEAVIYVVGHGEEGAMGLVVNQPVEDMRFADILEELGISGKDELIRLPSSVRDREVLRGGPVQRGRGFVLHSPDYFREENTYEVSDEVCLTATLDILKSIAFKPEPADAVFALGYCGWGAGQLENEIQANGWLHCAADPDLIFGPDVETKYERAMRKIGIDPAMLSSESGHA